MARTWSVRLRRIVARALTMLRAPSDWAFLGIAVVAHLAISLLGAGSLALSVATGEQPASVLLDASVLLFVLAGGCTAMLLLHASRSFPQAVSLERPMCQPRRVASVFMRSGIPVAPIPRGQAIARFAGEAPFSGLMDSVGHELRTPLNAIIGFSDMMQRELLGPLGSPHYREYVRHIHDSGLAMLEAAENTMALTALLAAPGQVRSEPVDLAALLDEAARCPQAHERGIRLVRGARCSARVRSEPAALRQALSNLVTAAVLGSPARRPIVITTRVVEGGVRLNVTVSAGTAAARDGRPAQRALAVARMLLELQGITLLERRCRDGAWRLSAVLPAAEPARASVRARSARVAAWPGAIHSASA